MRTQILAPAAALVLWTILMLGWLAVARFSAAKTVPKDDLRKLPRVGGRGKDIETVLPDKAAWPSHNYTHLTEQPTLFYAIVIILAIVGQGTGINLMLAWAYVALRVLHSIWQATVNTLTIRFGLFIASTVCLAALAVNALRATL